MPQIDKTIAPRSSADSTSLIPAIIHQTFISADLPDGTYGAARSWIDMNPEYEYRFYDDTDQIELIKSGFGEDVLTAYNKLPPGAFRADLWRYCTLYQKGGVYADIDTVCQTGLSEILRPDDAFVVPNAGTVPHAAFNAFICCSAGHPILASAIEYATKTVLSSRSFDGYAMVGPGALGTAINLSIGKDPRAPHQIGAHGKGQVSYRIVEKCAGGPDEPRRVVSEGKTVLITKYDGYLDDLQSAGITHWTADKDQGSPIIRPLKAAKRFVKRLMARPRP